MHGRRIGVLVGEFGFLAGSIGRAAADRIVAGIERATREGLPLVAAPVSGGTRMQEGTPAFVQMVRISAAVAAHRTAGLPYLVYLRHPTTGGVMASWGSLGHVTVAEPGALVGFLGPRVYEALYGKPFPSDVQTSENLYAHGIIDAVLPPDEIADILDRALTHPDGRAGGRRPGRRPRAGGRARRRRVGLRDPLAAARTGRAYAGCCATPPATSYPSTAPGRARRDPGLLIALARFGEAPCVFLGQDRRGQTTDHPMGPEALREARRGMRLASELGLPLVTVIDTQGAALSADAENGGLAGEIARSLADLVTLDAPDAVPDARRGQRRRRARAAARRPGGRGAARVALAAAARGRVGDRAPRPRPRRRDGARPAGAGDRPLPPRHRRPDRGREARRRRRGRGLLPPGRRRARARAQRAPRRRAGVGGEAGAPLRLSLCLLRWLSHVGSPGTWCTCHAHVTQAVPCRQSRGGRSAAPRVLGTVGALGQVGGRLLLGLDDLGLGDGLGLLRGRLGLRLRRSAAAARPVRRHAGHACR